MEICVDQSNNMVWSAARSYAKNGIYVNPVYVTRKSDGKKDVRPVGLWRTTSSTSLADIGAWEQEHPNSGLLIDCGKSGLVVVDCDGAEGIMNWIRLDPPVPLWVVETAGGGEHWYYRAHPDHPIGNDQDGKVAPFVDIRGLGGFVFAPPTTDGQGAWVGRGEPGWRGPGPYVPAVVIERMQARKSPTPAQPTVPTEVSNDLFEDVAREFTRDQAVAYIKTAMGALKGTTKGLNGAINNFAMTCAHFPWLVDRERCGQLMIKALGPAQGWTEPDRDDRLTINSAYSATEAGKSWVAVEVATPPKGTDPTTEGDVTGGILPSPARPLDVARELLARMTSTGGEVHWAWWRGDFYRWGGAHWEITDQPVIEKWLYGHLGDAVYFVPAKKDGEDPTQSPWAPNRKKIGDVAHALGVGILQRAKDEDKVIAAANGVVDLRTRELVEHRPSRFNLFSLPFDYDPAATAPLWDAFLEQVLPGDQQAKEFLAEWFGYVLSGRTDQHKIAALIGKKRSGKGTIGRVLAALAGRDNVSGLNLGTLSGTFGLEPFVGAALAVASDVRWKSRAIGDAVQILLEISGEDPVTVARKNRTAWKGRLGVRFMLMSNDTPTFSDRSGALVDRMIYVSFRQSFFGREDPALTDKLMSELPGIFNWALDGLERLAGRGRFTQPVSGQGEADATRRLADPVGAFLEDWCTLSDDGEILLDHLYLKYRSWCESEGRDRDSTTKEIFSRDVRNKLESLTSRRTRMNGKFVTILMGIDCSAI
jgi:putative DNA primase/helicase